jgi:hypothetical protein
LRGVGNGREGIETERGQRRGTAQPLMRGGARWKRSAQNGAAEIQCHGGVSS